MKEIKKLLQYKRYVLYYHPFGSMFYWNIFRFNSGYPFVSYKIGCFLLKRYL